MSDMEQIFPKRLKPKQINLLDAVKLMKEGKKPFVLCPKDGNFKDYEREDLEEFLDECFADCVICVDRWE